MPLLPAATATDSRSVSDNTDRLIEDLENDMVAVELLQQLEGQWVVSFGTPGESLDGSSGGSSSKEVRNPQRSRAC
jgi:hypothetical protein